jgi:AsmA protein
VNREPAASSRLLRRIALAAGAALAAVIVVLAVSVLTFDPNAYRDRVESAFAEATGRRLELQGEVSMTLFPWLGVDSGPARVASRAGFEGRPFATWHGARASVRVLPLLWGRIEVGRVELDGLTVNLAVTRAGEDNWSDLLQRLTSANPKSGSVDATADEPAEPVDFSIAGLVLRRTTVVFDDRQADRRFELRDGQLETGRLRADRPFELRSSLAMVSGGERRVDVTLQTRVDPTEAGRFVLDGTRGQVEVHRPGSDTLPVEFAVERYAYDTVSREGRLDGVTARGPGLSVEATLETARDAGGPSLRGPVAIRAAEPRRLLAAAGIEHATRDPGVLAQLSGTADLRMIGHRLEFGSLRLRLDDTQVEGRVAVAGSGASAEAPALEFDLVIDRLDLDRYRSPAAPAARVPVAPAVAPASGGEPPAGLRRLVANGDLRVVQLTVFEVGLSDVQLQLAARNGQLTAGPIAARAFGGSVSGNLRADITGATPSLRVAAGFDDVDVAAMLGQLLDMRRLAGRGHARTTIDARGRTQAALLDSMRGNFEMSVRDGRFLGTDLWREIEVAIAVAQRKPPPSGTDTGITEFRELSSRGTIAGRVFHNDRFRFSSSFLRVQGRGDVDFGRGRLDLDLRARLLKFPPGRLHGIKLSRLRGVDLPIEVTGPTADPQIRVDAGAIVGTVVIETIKDPLEGGVRKTLERLLKKK